VAARFEVFYRGIELGNGYHELTDPETQALRFEEDAQKRRELGLPSVPVDDRLLSALEAGMPPCAGIALGLDRLIMLALGKNMIQEVVSFADQQADLGPVKP
jgi:lysyl-tRNA synthetase class 2